MPDPAAVPPLDEMVDGRGGVRPHWRALLGMLAVSAAYLAGGTMLTPGLWLDPLGPFVKVLPSMVLAGLAIAILEER